MSEFLSFLYWAFYYVVLGSASLLMVWTGSMSILRVWTIVMLLIGHRYEGDDGRGT